MTADAKANIPPGAVSAGVRPAMLTVALSGCCDAGAQVMTAQLCTDVELEAYIMFFLACIQLYPSASQINTQERLPRSLVQQAMPPSLAVQACSSAPSNSQEPSSSVQA
jgi:hypothetical protein